MAGPRAIDLDDCLETPTGRLFTPERSAAAWEQAYADLGVALRSATPAARSMLEAPLAEEGFVEIVEIPPRQDSATSDR